MEMKSRSNDEELEHILVRWTWGRQVFRPKPPLASVEAVLQEFGSEVRSATAKKPDAFWQEQRNAIRTRMAPVHTRASAWRPTSLAWAGVLTVVILACFLLNSAPRTRLDTQARPQVDPDHLLLMQLEQTIEMAGPDALEPAALLADEMNQASQRDFGNYPVSRGKENEQ